MDGKECLKSRVVMVVDDQEDARAPICAFLERLQCRVVQAADGREALEMAAQLPDLELLITDVVMPHLDGPALAEALLGTRHGLKVLLISGYMAGPTVQRLMAIPGVDFLQKPFSFRSLVASAGRLLRDSNFRRSDVSGET